MSTVIPQKGSRNMTALPTTVPSQPQSSQPAHLRNNQNNHQTTHVNMLNNSDLKLKSPHQPSTPPRTPCRQEQSANGNAPETGSKQKPRSRRPKNVLTSPAMVRNGRNESPQGGQQSAGLSQSSAKPILTPSTTAFAGPTFHASPAPSALPIPSFYSKSVPESPGIETMKDSSPSPPDVPPPKVQVRREESPLDFFFRVDREEKARARSATLTATKPTGPFLPPSGSPQTSQTPPISSLQTRPRTSKRNSSSGMFAMEMDGDSSTGSPYGPSFSTPYSERINAVRPKSSVDQYPPDGRQTITSEALKAYLFSGHSVPSPNGSPSHSSREGPNTFSTLPATGGKRNAVAPSEQNAIALARAQHTLGRSSGLRQEVITARTPTKLPERHSNYTSSPTPTPYRPDGKSRSGTTSNNTGQSFPISASASSNPSTVNRNADLKGMEDTLRKILKLDSGSSDITGPNDRNGSTHTPSGPNYNHSSMNGMNNGVSKSS